jgi:Fur family transcriptional regulator, ferric uptake regulator
MKSVVTRSTKQKTIVQAILAKLEKFQSAQDIHSLITKSGEKVGLATVYRTLQNMAEAGSVDVVAGPEGEALYKACSTEHHHHLLCIKCGKTTEFNSPEIEKLAEQIAKKYKYSKTNHTIEISGHCKDCA